MISWEDKVKQEIPKGVCVKSIQIILGTLNIRLWDRKWNGLVAGSVCH
jgi:hypothetical protein